MKTAFELFSEEYGEDKLRWEICNYTPILEQFGEILIRVDEQDYQGDSFLIYKKDGAYGYLCFGWGSCSGCDRLQGCSTIHEVQELMDSLYNDILWFNSLGELKDYFAQKDWTLEYSWHLKEFKDFLFQVEKLEDKVNMCAGEVCGDNRFEVIAKAKQHLLDSTNIHTSEDEMKALDSFLFRCWQMGWLKQYDDTATDWKKVEDDGYPRLIEGFAVSEFVLVSWKIKVFDIDNVRGVSVAQYDYNKKQWLNRDDRIVVGVTHWMPITQPKEE